LKGIAHLIFILHLFYLLLMMNLDLLKRQLVLKSVKFGNAMVEEMEAWDLVELPDGGKHVGSKWVFKKKLNAAGKFEKYKARLVAKGYS
jgi:hypothetical protein